MEKWIVTGISGSGRIELLDELAQYAEHTLRKKCMVHDVGSLIKEKCNEYQIPVIDKLILDMDSAQLRLLRALALCEINLEIVKNRDIDLHLIGIHATFRGKGRLIPGISYQDIVALKPDGFINIVHDIKEIHNSICENPRWDKEDFPDFRETQDWMMEEELVTQVLSEVTKLPFYIVARRHNIHNLADLFFSKKKKVYLSYPITAVRASDPQMLEQIQGQYLKELETMFIVFDPLAIADMPLTYDQTREAMPELIDKITSKDKETIKKRTIVRDFQFIDRCDAVVVFYLTDKVSPGVLAEIYYAHRNQTPVFMVFNGSKSPFIEDATTCIEPDINSLMDRLRMFASLQSDPLGVEPLSLDALPEGTP